ncbi:MAG: hypothetical protein ACK568_13940, partial [Pseudanabaena sp.]
VCTHLKTAIPKEYNVYPTDKRYILSVCLRDLRLIKVPTASTSLSQRWLSEVEAIQTRWYFFSRQVPNPYS